MKITKRIQFPHISTHPRNFALIGFLLMLVAIPITVLYLRFAGPQEFRQRASNFAPVHGVNFDIIAQEGASCPDGSINNISSYGGSFSVTSKSNQSVNVILHSFFCPDGNAQNCESNDVRDTRGIVNFSQGQNMVFSVAPRQAVSPYTGQACGTYQVDLEFVGFNSYTYQSAFWCHTGVTCQVQPTPTATPVPPPPPTVTPLPTDTPTPAPPTPTPVPDTPTPTPVPTDTPVPSDTPTPTIVSSPTPTITPGGPTLTPSPTPTITPTPGSVVCTSAKPGNAPDLYQVNTTNTSATLYFVPAQSPVSDHRVSYGASTDASTTTALVGTGSSTGAIKYTVSNLTACTRYYFKVQGMNGCTNGDWSKTVGMLTQGCSASITPAPTLPSTGSAGYTLPIGIVSTVTLILGGLLLLAL